MEGPFPEVETVHDEIVAVELSSGRWRGDRGVRTTNPNTHGFYFFRCSIFLTTEVFYLFYSPAYEQQ